MKTMMKPIPSMNWLVLSMASIVSLLATSSFGLQPARSAAGNTLAWQVVTSPTQAKLNDISAVSPQDIWAVGDNETLIHYTGSEWVTVPTDFLINGGDDLSAIDMLSGSSGWMAGTPMNLIYWEGTSWEDYAPVDPFSPVFGISGIDADNAWMVGGVMLCNPGCDDLSGYIVHWYGPDLHRYDFDHTGLQDISMVNLNLGWAVGTWVDPNTKNWKSAILKWNGANWETVAHAAQLGGLEGVAALNENEAWAVGSMGTIIHWNGIQWSPVQAPTGINSTLLDVDIYSEDEAWAAGADGTLLHWDGQNWLQFTSPVTSTLNAISIIAPDDVWAVGDNGVILHYGPIPSPSLSLNFDSGAPGSYFSVTGQHFPANTQVEFKINHYSLGSVITDMNGNLNFILDANQADPGDYILLAVGVPSFSTRFLLDPAALIREKEQDGVSFSVPGGIAYTERVLLPVIFTGFSLNLTD